MALGRAQSCVAEFHRRMIGPEVAPDEPVAPAAYNGELRCSLIEEEAQEFRSAWEARDRLAMVDALCDLLYVTLGAGVEMGVDLDPFFREVHRANMNKVGGPVRADGKQLKPPGWSAPDLDTVYRRLFGAASRDDSAQTVLPIEEQAPLETAGSQVRV
ncbi:MAG TPA: hypothetical protein VFB34_03005 [Chloroflexota bacterium]|nr:hypothetical protein [Chloroflexota bacterium]